MTKENKINSSSFCNNVLQKDDEVDIKPYTKVAIDV